MPDVSMPSQDVLDAAKLYIAYFMGRDDVYSFWSPGKTPEESHWRPAGPWDPATKSVTPVPITPEKIVNAFRTGVPLSGYMLGPDNHTHVAALDIDREDGMELGKKFIRYLVSKGGYGYLEGSRRGCHVWMTLSQRRPGLAVLRALRALCREAGLPQDPKHKAEWRPEEHVELRPAIARLAGPGALDKSIRLPTMPHQRTGQRYALISAEGEVLPAKLIQFIPEIRECPVTVFDEAAERAPLPPLTRQPSDLRWPAGRPQVEESASALLVELWSADPVAAPGKVISCPAIAYHSNGDRHKGLSILRDDERAICHKPGCVLNNDGRGRGTRELRALAAK